jgi:formate dehydrogenase subunit gamma
VSIEGSSPPHVLRFAPSERAAHWLTAGGFFGMLLSGLALGKGGGPFHRIVLSIHLGLAALVVVGLAALVLRRRTRRVLAATAGQLRRLDALDRRWLAGAPRRLLDRSPAPPAGRFNAGQKMNARLATLGLGALYVTGIGEFLPGPLRGLHGLAAGLMTLLVAGHVYMAVLNPGTRPGLRGMVRGDVDRTWARRHHPRWLSDQERADAPGRSVEEAG